MAGDHRGLVVVVLLAGLIATAGAAGGEGSSPQVQKPPTNAAQRVDRSKPPETAEPGAEFTVRRLTVPPTIDGRTWMTISQVSAAGPLRAPNGQFTLTLEEATSVEVVHYRVDFSEGGGARVQLDPGGAVYAFISADSRWIITGPLEVIDVTNWRRYSLSSSFRIEPFVVLRALSSDGRRLLISRQPCPFDCRNFPDEYFEIGLPGTTAKG